MENAQNTVQGDPDAPRGAAPRILIVDDDPGIRDVVSDFLTRHGYAVETAQDARTMEQILAQGPIDLVVLDVMLPGEDGLAICRRLSAAADGPAIIMLSAMGEETDRIVGLELGADDYLPKPFRNEELLARLRAIVRRSAGHAAPVLSSGDLTLDERQMKVSLSGVPVALSQLEYRLIAYLLRQSGRVVPQHELEENVYGLGHEHDSNALEVLVRRVRKKLGADIIETRRGFGYLIPETAE